MNIPRNAVTTIPQKYAIPLFLALIIAGLAGNYFNFPIFLNIDFLFGSIFAILALQFFGFGWGILAAAVIASYTCVIGNHPFSIIIMTTEVAIVGWLAGRRKMGVVQADMLYWLIIGMPLIYLFYHFVMHVPYSDTNISMTKQAVNGIANALVARLIFTGVVLRSRSSLISYSEIVSNLLVLFVVCPTLIMLAVDSRTDFAETDSHIRNSLNHDSKLLKLRIDNWVVNRKHPIVNLGKVAAVQSAHEMQPFLEQAKESDPNFLRVGLLDKEATVTAYYPLTDELGQNIIGRNYADRPFIPTLKRTLKPMLSEVVMGKVGIPRPIVMVIVPVLFNGEYGGYVAGTLDLKEIQTYLDLSVGRQTSYYTLLDKNGHVIMTNRTDQMTMTPFVRGKGTLSHSDNEISQWGPDVPPNTPVSERWGKSFYVEESSVGDLSEWKLILEQPVAPFHKTLYAKYTGKLTILFLILLGALIFADLISRLLIDDIEKLRSITHDLPIKLLSDSLINWPESGVKECAQLIENFREMSRALTDKFIENRRVIEELRGSRQQLLDIIDFFPDATFVVDNEKKVIAWNRTIEMMSGVNKAEMLGQGDYAYTIPFYGEKRQNMIDLLDESNADLAVKYQEVLTENGILYGETFCPALYGGKGAYVWATVAPLFNVNGIRVGAIQSIRDITSRRLAEEELKKAYAEMEQRVEERTSQLTNIMNELSIILMNAPIGILKVIDRKSVWVNHKTEELFLYSKEELVSHLTRKLYPSEEAYEKLGQDAYPVLAQGKVFETVQELVRKDGLHVMVRFIGKAIEPPDMSKGTLWLLEDFTERTKAEELRARSLNEKTVMLKEIHHRVKNNMTVVYSLLNLQSKKITDPVYLSMFEESRNRVMSMALIHEKLYQSNDLAHIDFKAYLKELVAGIEGTYKLANATIVVDMGNITLDVNQGIPCGLIVNELVTNSLKYAFPDGKNGTITLGISRKSEDYNVLTVSDNGIGFPAEVDFRDTSSLGLQLVNALTMQINGTIELSKSGGTSFSITFPVPESSHSNGAQHG